MNAPTTPPDRQTPSPATLTARIHAASTRRRLAILSVVVALVGGGVAAYAQFSASGGGTGSFTSTTPGAVTISSPNVGPLYPQINPADTTPLTVTVSVGGSANEFVGQITGTVQTVGGCLGSWFTVAPIAAPGDLTPGNHTFSSSVILNDDDRDQSACAGQTETINWTSESS